MDRTVYDNNGQLLETVVYDLAAGTVTTTVTGQSPVTAPIEPALLTALLADQAADRRRQRLDTAAATLRQWAADARATSVGPMTVAQHKVVTQTVVDRLGVFFDRFADLLDER